MVRIKHLEDIMSITDINPKFRMIKQTKCENITVLNKFFHANPIRYDQEGWVIRDALDLWVPGSRSWGYQKIVVTPSEDLPLVQVDEAISKDGDPLGMAGKLWVMYMGNKIGCGPGALDHTERAELFKRYEATKNTTWNNPIIEVKYKRDDTYDALREARFVSFRPDKD